MQKIINHTISNNKITYKVFLVVKHTYFFESLFKKSQWILFFVHIFYGLSFFRNFICVYLIGVRHFFSSFVFFCLKYTFFRLVDYLFNPIGFFALQEIKQGSQVFSFYFGWRGILPGLNSVTFEPLLKKVNGTNATC